jgi:hypothetical protein
LPRVRDLEERKIRAVRAGLCLAGIGALGPAPGFLQSAHWATDLWPWPDTPLSFVFIASIIYLGARLQRRARLLLPAGQRRDASELMADETRLS